MAPLNSNFNFLEFGKDASKLGRYGGAVEFLQSPSLRTGASAGLKYFANANPYYAGINAITRGGLDKLLDKGLGAFKKRGPAQNAKETTQLIDYARRSMEDTNRLRDVYGQSITNAEQAKAARDLFRKSVARLKAEGASAREMQPMMAQIVARNAQLGQASQSRLAANLSARGINPATGIGAGAMAGLEGQLAGANASGMAQLQTAALNRALQGEQMLFSADVADQARANANAMASAGAIAEQNRAIAAFQEQQKLAQQARDQAMWERRMKESSSLGQGLMGAVGLYQQLRRKQNESDPNSFLLSGWINPDLLGPNSQTSNVTGTGITAPSGYGQYGPFGNSEVFNNSGIVSAALSKQYPMALEGDVQQHSDGFWYKKTSNGWIPAT